MSQPPQITPATPPTKPPAKKWLSHVLFVLLTLLVVMALVCVLFFYALGTQAGTAFVIEQISQRTNIKLRYGQGNLRDGLWVSDVQLSPSDTLTIKVNKAYVSLGWRALFMKQVHLVDTQIDTLQIIDKVPPTGEPFAYQPISMPVALYVNNAHVKTVSYQQATQAPLELYDIKLAQGKWADTRLWVGGGQLQYAQDVMITNIKGQMDFVGHYPLDIKADVDVAPLKDNYFDTLSVHAKGTLKRTTGTLAGKYNQYPVQGDFVAQSLDDNLPFETRLVFDEVLLPYAEEQNIVLKNGVLYAQGVLDKIELRLNTHLSAKDIPTGHYAGRGLVYDGGMSVDTLVAKTASGQLNASGKMSWVDEFELNAKIDGKGYQIRDALPLEYKEYQAYLPKTLHGSLGVEYVYLDKKRNQTRLAVELNQQDGEKVRISLAQSQEKANAPWHISADWQNLVRAGVPQLEHISSQHGRANIRLEEGRTFIDANAQIQQLSVAPKGEYIIKANIEKGERIHLEHFVYQGVMGDLSGRGRIDLATVKTPLKWQFDLKTHRLLPNAYFNAPNKTPLSVISGRVLATGRMRDTKQGQRHDVELTNSDLTATINDKDRIHLVGNASGSVVLQGDTLTHLDAKFDGSAQQSLLPQIERTKLGVWVQGNLDKLQILKFTAFNSSAKVSAAGQVGLTDGIDWQIKARIDELDSAKFVKNDQLIAKITGDLDTKGAYKNNQLRTISAKFDGQVLNKHLPNGKLSADIVGNGRKLVINRLSHTGQMGDLQLKGNVNLGTLSVDMHAQSKRFNVAAFVAGMSSELTGGFDFAGSFGGQTKSLSVQRLDIKGQLNAQPFSASGALMAKLTIPDNLTAYFKRLKTAATPPKSTDELVNLQRQIEANTRQTQQIIKQLKADNLHVSMGDNFVKMHGSEQQLTTALQINKLSQILPSARGMIAGGVILVNDANALPTLYIDLKADDVRTADGIVQKVNVLGKIENLAHSPSQLLVEIDDIIAFGKVVKSARIDFRGTQQNHQLSVLANGLDVATQARIDGGYDDVKGMYRGILAQGQVKSKFGLLTQKQPSQFAYHIKDGSIQVAPHCWQTSATKAGGTGLVCLQDTLSYSSKAGNVNVVLQNLDTAVLSPALPSDIVWKSALNGKVQARWQHGAVPQINAVLYSDNGRVGVTQDDTGYVEMPYERVSLIAQSVPTGLKLRTDIAGVAGRGYIDVLIDPYKANKPIAGAMAVNEVNLAVLRPFFPNLQALSGSASMAGGVGGTLSRPLFFGNAELKGGRVAVVGVPLSLNDIELTGTIRGTQAQLDGTFYSGEGRGTLTGYVDWQSELQAKIGVSGKQLTIDSPPMLMAQFSPDIEVIIRPPQKYVKVQGVISLPSATIRPPDASADIVAQSDDVVVIDRRLTGNVAQMLKVSAPWSINADIGLDLGDDVVFRGFGARLPLAGALHLTQSGRGAMQARGVVQVAKRAKVDGIGQNLELNYAQIRFNGNMLNPRLSIEGEKQIEGQTVGLRIKGTASSPEITVFNDAGLTEQQAMNALITGRISEASDAQTSEQTFRSQVTNNLAAAGLSLGLSGTHNITNQIGSALGLESLTVDASGSSSDTSVNITGYISPDLYIRYGVGVFSAESSLSMRYQLTRRIYIEATRATENVVDVIYRWKF